MEIYRNTKSTLLRKIGITSCFLLLLLAVAANMLLVYILFFTQYWYMALGYLAWFYYDRETPTNGGRSFELIRKIPFAKWAAQYFPVSLVRTAELDTSRNYLLACHPHGISLSGILYGLVTDACEADRLFAGFRRIILSMAGNFKMPLARELGMAFGSCSVSYKSITNILKMEGGGKLLMIVPGGVRESLYCHPGTEQVYLMKRKGFVRVAIEHGVPLVPVYIFGESEVYTQLANPEGSWLRNFQEKAINAVGGNLTLFNGRGLFQSYFGLLPRDRPITVVVGDPIEVRQVQNPTVEFVDTVHKQYVEALHSLYNANRHLYGNPKVELIIH